MNVLVVDDKRVIGDFFDFTLGYYGHTIKVVHDPQEAIPAAQKEHFDVAFLDIIMPKKDGFATLVDIFKDKELKKIPVLIFSTLSQEQDVQKGLKLGAVGYVNKTFFDFDNLKSKIEEAVKKGVSR